MRSDGELLHADAAFVASQAGRFEAARELVEESEIGTESAAAVLTGAYLALYQDGEVLESHRRIVSVLRDADIAGRRNGARLAKVLLAVTLYSGRAAPVAADRRHHRSTRRAARSSTLCCTATPGETSRGGATPCAPDSPNDRTRLAVLEPWDIMRLGVTAYYVDALADLRPTLARVFQRERIEAR